MSQTVNGTHAARAGSREAIAGNAGLIMHDGDVAAGETIEERRFPYVRAPNDGDIPGEWRCALARLS